METEQELKAIVYEAMCRNQRLFVVTDRTDSAYHGAFTKRDMDCGNLIECFTEAQVHETCLSLCNEGLVKAVQIWPDSRSTTFEPLTPVEIATWKIKKSKT